MFVVGKADIDTPPNIASCSLSLRSLDPDANQAESVVNASLKAVLVNLAGKGIAPADIESFQIEKQIMLSDTRNKEPASIRGYDLTRQLKFTARKLDMVPSIELSLLGSANIQNVNCQFDRTDPTAIEADLLTKALHSAKDRAG